MKFKLITALLLSLASLPSVAQLVSQLSGPSNDWVYSTVGLGQSFTAPASANIRRISVRPLSNFTGSLHIYNSAAGSGVPGGVGIPAYTESGISLVGGGDSDPLQDIVLTTPFPVIAGSSYSFVFGDEAQMFSNRFNPYIGGSVLVAFSNTNSFFSDYDLVFQVWGTLTQAIAYTSTAPASAKVGDSYTVSATGGGSGLGVLFAIDPSASTVCTIAGATVTMMGVGTCVINATQPGDATYDPAPQVQQSFAVAAAAPIAPTTQASIPTLSEWGVILMSVMLGLFAALRMRSRA